MPRTLLGSALILLFLVASPRALRAQDDRQAACAAAIDSLQFRSVTPEGDRCKELAAHVGDALARLMRQRPIATPPASPRTLQSRASGNAGGTTGSEAVATTQPIALAGGTLAAFGGGGGADAIAAISLNPLTLLGGGDKPSDARKYDITLLAPTGNDTDSLRYLGVRVRYNVESKDQRRVLDEAERLFREGTRMRLPLLRELERLFAEAPAPAACARQLIDPGEATAAREACGAPFDVSRYALASRAFEDYTASIRDSLDQHYFGLDLRYDRGDPTFGAVPGLDGTFLYAGVAFGRRTHAREADGATIGWRARIAGQYIVVDSGPATATDANGIAADIAFAFEATYPAAFRPIRLLGGLEYRSGSPLPTTTDDALELDGLRWRLSLDIPVTAANGIAVAYSTPLSGGGRPTLNVSFNWQMLLREIGR